MKLIDKDALVAEIEKLHGNPYYMMAVKDVLAIIDSMQEEPVKIKKGCKYRSICNVTNNDTGNISFVAGKIYLAPKDNTLVSEENGWLCDTSENASNFELVEEPVCKDLKEAASMYAKEEYNHKNPATLPDRCRGCYAPLIYAFKAGAKWKEEQINEALLSEVLPCFMHGGEADEVVAKLDEVLNQKK